MHVLPLTCLLQGLAFEDDEDVKPKRMSKSHSRTPSSTFSTATTPTPSGKKKKILLKGFSPISEKLAGAAHSKMCIHLATEMAFPSAAKRGSRTWEAIVAGAGTGTKVLNDKLEVIRHDDYRKEEMLSYVSSFSAFCDLSNLMHRYGTAPLNCVVRSRPRHRGL